MARTVAITLAGHWQLVLSEWRRGLAVYSHIYDHHVVYRHGAAFVPTALPHWDTQAMIENLVDAAAGSCSLGQCN